MVATAKNVGGCGGGGGGGKRGRLNAIFVTGREEFFYYLFIYFIFCVYLLADLVSKHYEWRQIARVLQRNYSLVGSTADAAVARERNTVCINVRVCLYKYTHTDI